jgi:hypothetical protein
VSVTQIMPSTINTPLFDNARTKMGVKPVAPATRLPGAGRRRRDRARGRASRPRPGRRRVGQNADHPGEFAPRLVDALLRRVGYEIHDTGEPKPAGAPDNLDAPLTTNDTVEGRVGG